MSELIFVTGASGFLGSHIVDQLLQSGYRVRAAARPSKVEQLRSGYITYGKNFEVVAIPDIASDQFPEALKGVHAVIHAASPIPQRSNHEEMLKVAVEGTLNVVRQAEKAGIQRIVVTSSIATVLNPRDSFTDKDWNQVTREEALSGSKSTAYLASKTFAEQALWDFADSHPHVDVTTFNPPFLYGPFASGFSLPTPDYYAMSTNLYIYRLITATGPFPSGPRYIDVRDVAKAHVLALKSPLSSMPGIGRKRLIISSIYGFDYEEVLELLKTRRPELAARLTRTALPPIDKANLVLPFDVDRVERVVGMRRQDYTTFEDTMLDTVDSILALEKDWIKKGYTIEVPKE